jgi:hypothetical protein
MRHPVSTPSWIDETLSGCMQGGIAGFAIDPGAPDDAQPSTKGIA